MAKWRPKGPLTSSPINPRHDVWIEDEEGIRRIQSETPGEDEIIVGGRTYVHTREIGSGQWVYTLEGS